MENNLIFDKIITRHEKYKKTSLFLQRDLEDIVTEIYNETGIDKVTIRYAVVSQFRFIRDIVKQCKKPAEDGFDINTYKSVRLRYLGKFEPKPRFVLNQVNKNV